MRTAPERCYDQLIDAFGLRDALDRELAEEAEYSRRVLRVVTRSGGDTDSYDLPSAFAGGEHASALLLNGLLSRARPVVPSYAGLWPAGGLSASVLRDDGIAVIAVDAGLWFWTRYACQQVVEGLAAITGTTQVWGEDRLSDPMEPLTEELRAYVLDGSSLRQRTRLTVMRGPREQFRRDMNLGAMAYVVAHEVGHLHQDGQLDTADRSPVAEIEAQALERIADRHAWVLLEELTAGHDPTAVAAGAMIVLLLHAFELRTRQVAGFAPAHWSHPAPELRAYEAQSALAGPRGDVLEQLRQWLWIQLELQELFAQVPDDD